MASGPFSLSIPAFLITAVLPTGHRGASWVFHRQRWLSSVVSGSLALDHGALCSFIDVRRI